MTIPCSTGPDGVAPPNSSGIKVIVVGLGIGGLAAAIECHRKGHAVMAFDKIPVHTDTHGDLLGISTNSARVIAKWGEGAIHEILSSVKNASPATEICDTAGRTIMPADMTGYKKEDGYWVLRSMLAATLYEHALSLGIDLHVGMDAAVTDYWETDEEAGVIINGERFAADCVICCDGINSNGRQIILHEDPPLKSTKEYVFRTSFTTVELKDDPAARWILNGMDECDRGKVFKGRGLEVGFSSFENGQTIVLSDLAMEKLGRPPGSLDDVMQIIADWPIQRDFAGLLKHIPPLGVIHHPIALRDCLKTWISAGGRTIVIGDAAHSYLPIFGQGGSQAIEDAAVLAIALELSGKGNVRQALQFSCRRKPRATRISEASWAMHNDWYNQDWDAVAKDPKLLKSSRPGWVLSHDCQAYAYEEYQKVVHAMETNQEYIPTNVPADGGLGLNEKMTLTGEMTQASDVDR
ncbi:FAD-dependent oxidoreductase [Aspergillus thermomutatus]|uniref:FAD-binding domain-containing protein n=1 Tax=Aspergillus thermomutatus TaxID=41047 RepID=A0A397G5Z9_ASPTH|nr:uncharacterized protein CDV56_102749 [Aspergillus thermomutatus]RHZ46415.1 hypothetical protein CDV56_102749 [Aspergillus thermomutatus]